MSVDASLFGDDEPAPPANVPSPTPIAGWQVNLLRKALDARGLSAMADRQALIEELAERPVESLRGLTHEEGLRVLAKLGESGPSRSPGSAWDEREEDTWIDRL